MHDCQQIKVDEKEEKKTLRQKIGSCVWRAKDWLRHNCKPFDYLETKYYNLVNGVGNIVRWFPVVWKDRPWDFEGYFGPFLRCKLEELNKRPYEDMFVDGDWAKRYLKLCLWLMDEYKRLDNTYCPEGMEEPIHRWIPSGEFYGKEETVQLVIDWKKPTDEEEYHQFRLKNDERMIKVRRLLFLILEKRGQCWWD
jgi:hypothetical protein